MSWVGSEAGSEGSNTSRNGDIVKTGYLKKLKTMKKKYFVLRADARNTSACLEYYDSGKKWKNNHPPKRNIILKNCLSINRRTDTKHKYVIALFSGADCFGIVLDSEDDLHEWLRLLLIHQQGDDVDSSCPKPYFEHVWRVTIQKKELAGKHNLSGVFLLCLSDCTLSLVKHVVDDEQESKFYEFSLQSIRRCGNLDAFFYMELGQASCLGAGNLWMQADDSNVAQNMHSVIMNACTSCPKKEMPLPSRSRSSSANEASKPIYFGRKWPSSGDDAISVLSYTKSQSHHDHTVTISNSTGHSVSSMGDGTHHHPHSLASVPFSPYPPIRRASTGTRPITTGPALLSSGRTNASYAARERCDSLPTRPRMVLDTLSGPKGGNSASYLTSTNNRPHSMYNRSVLSPTGCSHPASPISATYSNDSAGSSLSVDDSENWSENDSIRKIIEETPSEYVQWGANQNKNFLAENIPASNNISRNMKPMFPHSSSNSQSSCSPCSSSSMDAAVYIPMSPESVADNRNRPQLNRSFDSVNHSRESSIHEDIAEGYVPMAPLSVDAGYISMDHSGRKQGDLSSGLSSCSITSGTPSTDVRFSEFHLDKVSSYFTPSDEDFVFNVRQTRAYSTGSKPDTLHNKFGRCDSADGLRARAFSVGSRCNTHNAHNMPPTPRRTPASTSTSSIEPCDDLMEIDFSANKLRNRHLRSRIKHHQKTTPGIVHTSAEKLTVPHNSLSNSGAAFSVLDGYMDMSPKSSSSSKMELLNESRVSSSDANLSPPRLSKHLLGRSSPAGVNFSKQVFAKGSPSSASNMLEKVLEMESANSKQQHGSFAVAAAVDEDDCSYMDMKPGVSDMPLETNIVEISATSVNNLSAISPAAAAAAAAKENASVGDAVVCRTPTAAGANVPRIKQPLLDTDGKQLKVDGKTDQKCSTPDGYIDMTFKGRAKAVESPAAKLVARIPEKTPDGYVDMSFKGSRKNLVDSNSSANKSFENKTPPCCSGKENQLETRQCSKPIAIQQTKNKRSNSSAGFFRRKLSGDETHMLKPNFLPLMQSTFASLGRKKKAIAAKREAIDSPANTSSTIFPLSPDRTSAFIATTSAAATTPAASTSPSTSSTSLDYDPNSKCAITASGESVRLTSDFEIRSLERVDEMVNWDRKCGGDEDSDNGDYIVMTPGVVPKLERKVSEPLCLRAAKSGEDAALVSGNGGHDVTVKTLQRCTSVPSTISGMRCWQRSTSSPEVAKTGDHTRSSGSESDVTVDDPLSQRMMADACQQTTTQCQSDVPKTGAPATLVRDRETVMYATLDIPPSDEEQPKNDSTDLTKLANQSSLTYAQIDFEKPSSSSSSPSK